ncbi:MAG: hypothetical protein ACLGRW_10005 [Acidobacteriota bacterium]
MTIGHPPWRASGDTWENKGKVELNKSKAMIGLSRIQVSFKAASFVDQIWVGKASIQAAGFQGKTSVILSAALLAFVMLMVHSRC